MDEGALDAVRADQRARSLVWVAGRGTAESAGNMLAAVLGAPELADDARFSTNADRVAHRAELVAALDGMLASDGADAWQERITAAGVPCGPINDIAQGLALAERLGLQPVVEIADPRRGGPQPQVAHPATYSVTPPTYRTAPPEVDEDRAEVLAMLGLEGS